MPDLLKPPPPKRVDQEERELSTESTPVLPSKVRSGCYTHKAVGFADYLCTEGQGNEGQRHGDIQNQGKTYARQGINKVTQPSRATC